MEYRVINMSDYVIQTFDLTKKYKLKKGGFIKALNNVNISIKEGEIFGWECTSLSLSYGRIFFYLLKQNTI